MPTMVIATAIMLTIIGAVPTADFIRCQETICRSGSLSRWPRCWTMQILRQLANNGFYPTSSENRRDVPGPSILIPAHRLRTSHAVSGSTAMQRRGCGLTRTSVSQTTVL